jgi:DNA repair photolyase
MDVIPDLPLGPEKGRGAISNTTGRYESEVRLRTDDGWGPQAPVTGVAAAESADAHARTRTKILVDATRTAITRNTSPDIPFDRSINPYRGCEHGCIYCYARPSHAWLGLSPGLDFETRILAKPDAAKLLAAEIARKGYHCKPLALGTNTDPYQPIERKLRITRAILEVLDGANHPISIVTKSDAVLQDLDILSAMAERNLVKVFLSVTTLNGDLARKLEPRAAAPAKRLKAVTALAGAGVPVGVMVAPVIPALTDFELEAILDAAKDAGAGEAGYILLRLPLEVKDLFAEWLAAHVPDRAERVLKLVRETRGGRLNDATFGRRMRGEGVYAQLIARRFRLARERLDLNSEDIGTLDTLSFAPPSRGSTQLSLF